MYFFGVVLAFCLAFAVGAVAVTFASGQFGLGQGGSTTLSGTNMITTLETGGTSTSADTTLKTSGSTGDEPSEGSGETSSEASFVHRADEDNSREDYTYISNPAIDGKPDAVILVSAVNDDEPYGHNIGVRYDPTARRWAIFNQDQSSVPVGAEFNVTVPQPSLGFVHRADPDNTVGNATYLYGPLTNGKPDAEVTVTQNWNPDGGEGVYNNHPVSVFYDGDVDQWAIYNRDNGEIPEGAAFNVSVSANSS